MQKKYVPHVIAIAVFALLTILYLLPYYQGMTLSQGDVIQWEGMSKEIRDWNEQHPDEPALWTSRMFGGMPAYQIAIVYTGNFVSKIVRSLQVIFPDAAVLLFLMFAGFYVLLLCFDVSPWLSLAGALAYGVTTFGLISIEAGHNTKVQAMSLMAPVIGGLVAAYRGRILIGAAVTALFFSMVIDANHLQIAYYLAMTLGVLGVYFLIESIIEKQLPRFAKATGMLLLGVGLAVLPNVANLWATQEYAKETIRGGSSELTAKREATKGGGLDFEYATRWSYGFTDGEILSLLIPNIKGGGSGNTLSDDNKMVQRFAGSGYPLEQIKKYIASQLYWGNQPFTSGPVYFGAAVVFLFVFSLLILQNNIKWALLVLTLLSITLSFGHNFFVFRLFFDYLPFFNKFRTPAMALVIAELTMPLMAVLALHQLLTQKADKERIVKMLKISGGITGGIVLLFGVMGGMFFSFSGAGDAELMQNNPDLLSLIKEERASMLRADAIRSLVFIGAAFALLWFWLQQKISVNAFIAAFAAVFLIDGWMVGKRYLNSDNFVEKSAYGNNHTPSRADMEILQDTDPNFRVFNVTTNSFNDAMTSYFHKSVGGYHAAKLIRYQDLIENQISKNNMSVLNMLNTKYFIVPNPQTKEPVAQRNPDALGNAWFVNNIQWVANADEEMAALSNFNPSNTVVIDNRYKGLLKQGATATDSSATIQLTAFTPNKLSYAYNAAANAVAVFSEVYYSDGKGWNAYIDGQPAPHFRCNYVLRGMELPAGQHQVEFRFEPQSVVTGNKVALAGSFLLFAFVLGTFGFYFWQNRNATPIAGVNAPTNTSKKK